jgi:hypothetical protein
MVTSSVILGGATSEIHSSFETKKRTKIQKYLHTNEEENPISKVRLLSINNLIN